MSNLPVFEIVQSDAKKPWHVRIRAANHEPTWSTQRYTRKQGADRAVRALVRIFGGMVVTSRGEVWDASGRVVARVVQRDERRLLKMARAGMPPRGGAVNA